MWNRAELKDRAKTAFKQNYWRCVLISLILMLFTGGSAGSARSEDHDDYVISDHIEQDYVGHDLDRNMEYHHERSWASVLFDRIAAMVLGGVMLAILLLGIFVFCPLEVGGCRFFIENAYERPGAGKILFAFQSGHYGKIVFTLFCRGVFIFLWGLLLVIPGIVKAYEYRMVPYLLADCPQMSREDAFGISREMMQGQKMNAFILDLSFIGWHLLSAVTFGLLEIFYVAPYVNATDAELFLTLREQHFQRQNP
ncbi:MAG: DUF975 family protein [Lachnospiraceae bacterium]|jgi:hypothetical protein